MHDYTKISKREVEDARIKQDGLCAICKKEARLVIDHCHESRKFRGLLCSHCNKGLGFFTDNPEVLRAAADYLSSF